MTFALLLAALLTAQEEVIQRTDPLRSQYQEAVELCRAAEDLVDRDPEAAAVRFTELLEKFGALPRIERRLRIKVFADDPGSPTAFFPYQFRGRARLAAADAAKVGVEERADRVEAAVRDFERSVDRGAASSKPMLQAARLGWWTSLRPLLAREGWEPKRAGAAEKARGLLRDLAQDGQERAVVDAASWLSEQLTPVEARVRGLRRDEAADRQQAAQDSAWCRSTEHLLENLPAAKEAAARARAVGARAGAIAGFRGSFRLKISAAPWAEVTKLSREGKDVSLAARETPLVVPEELEIGDYEIELAHPRWGRRTQRIPARELQEGKTYLLSADLEAGTMTLRLSP